MQLIYSLLFILNLINMSKTLPFLISYPFFFQVITWFQNRRAKLKRDMEELKKDVETVKVLTAHKSFLENVNDMNILKKKATNDLSHNDCIQK